MRVNKCLWMGAAMFALATTGCGDGANCGAGTVEVDGECIPASMIMCGPGTVNDGMGNCVPDMSVCGAGTTFDPATGMCNPDVTCAAGTVAMMGECVPDGTVICDDGTVFDPATGTCMLAEGACAEGTVLLDGVCRPADDALVPDVNAAAEPDDSLFNEGTAGSFTPPAVGEMTTLGGCIEPADWDMDGVTDFDIDIFNFNVAGPTYLRVNADGLGGLAAGFAIQGQDVALLRVGVNLVGDTSERHVYLPAAGAYSLIVFDSRTLDLPNISSGIGFATPVGGPDACYYVTVESKTIPTPTDITGMTDSMGTLSDEPTFLQLAPTTAAVYDLQVTEDSPAATGILSVSVGDAIAGGTRTVAPKASMADPLLVVVTDVVNISFDPVDWTLDIREVPEISMDGTVTLTHGDEPLLMAIPATAGDVLHFGYSSAAGDSLDIALVTPDFTSGSFITPFGGASVGDEYFYAVDSGSYVVQIENLNGTVGMDYDVDVTISSQTPPVLTAGAATTLTLQDTRTFAFIDTSANIWSRYSFSSFMGAGFTEVDVRFWADDSFILAGLGVGSESSVTDVFGRIHGLEMGENRLVEINDADGFDMDESVDVLFDSEMFEDITTVVGTPEMRAGDAVPADGAHYYFLRGNIGELLTFTATGASSTNVVIDQLDTRVRSIENVDASGVDEAEVFTTAFGEDGWIALSVSAGAAGGMVDVDISVEPPPYSVSAGTSTFATICTGSNDVGLIDDGSGFGGSDDGLSNPITLTTFGSGFNFFGTSESTIVVSSNGWLSFGTPADSEPFLPSIPTAGGDADNLIAVHALDLTDIGVCMTEEAGRIVLEWNGRTFTGSNTVEMQVILLGDGSIETVYGPNHAVPPNPDRVGVENSDGSIGVRSTLSPDPGTAILFTPAP